MEPLHRRQLRGFLPEGKRFLLCAALGTLLSLAPIWSVRFLPMQDHPQHLFVSHVFNSFGQAEFDWPSHFERRVRVAPYSLHHLVLYGLSWLVGIETAGKLFVSLYVLLAAGFVATEARARREGPVPWALLLVFPLLFSQVYYLGFESYFFSIPVVLIALRGLARFAARPPTVRSVAPQVVWLALLYLSHPYSCLIYAGLGAATAALQWPDRARCLRAMAPPLALLGMLAAWSVFVIWQGTTAYPGGAESATRWWPLSRSLAYFLLMFTGMRLSAVSWLDVALWAIAAAALLAGALRRGRRRGRGAGGDEGARGRGAAIAGVQAVLAGLAYLALPFASKSWLGHSSYVNLRLAPFCYLLIAQLASHVPLRRWQQRACAVASIALLFTPLRLHRMVSSEISELLPVLEVMQPNQRVLPIYRDAASAVLDPRFFYQFHSHMHAYYHVLVGGGASRSLFATAFSPIAYAPGVRLPSLEEERSGGSPSRERLARDYRYLLIRDSGDAGPDAGQPGVVARTRHWTLVDTRVW
jgi:hypothetical protein